MLRHGGPVMVTYLAVQALYLLLAAVGQVLPRLVDGGEQQLGVSQQRVSPLQISPELLLHIKVSVADLHTIHPSAFMCVLVIS